MWQSVLTSLTSVHLEGAAALAPATAAVRNQLHSSNATIKLFSFHSPSTFITPHAALHILHPSRCPVLFRVARALGPNSRWSAPSLSLCAERWPREEALVLEARLFPAQGLKDLRADQADEVLSGACRIDAKEATRAASHVGHAFE